MNPSIVFCIPLWNHHVGPLCREIAKLHPKGCFKTLLLCSPSAPGYKAMCAAGWDLNPPKEDWVVGPPKVDNIDEIEEYTSLISTAKIVIAPLACLNTKVFKQRIRRGKTIFVINERFFKKKVTFFDFLNPRFLRMILRIRFNLRHSCVHFLTMGHWCSDDLKFLGVCKNRVWPLGYFPDVPSVYASHAPIEGRKIRIGWVGRMLDWKQPDLLVAALSRLTVEELSKCEVYFVGEGPFLDHVKDMVVKNGLAQSVSFEVHKKAADIPPFMHQMDVYAFTSGREEGWGAVLNEAMGQGCAIIANEDAGSTLELMSEPDCGFLFKGRDVSAISDAIRNYIANPNLASAHGRRAYDRICAASPSVKASYLVDLFGGFV